MNLNQCNFIGRLWHTHNPPLTPGDGMALLAIRERQGL